MSDEAPAATPFDQAIKDMKLSPQEQYLYNYHLGNLYSEGKVVHPSGDISTLMQAVVSGPGGYYNVPTVKDGQMLTMREAQIYASQIGWGNFPKYATPEEADARYKEMHKYIDQDTAQYMRQNR